MGRLATTTPTQSRPTSGRHQWIKLLIPLYLLPIRANRGPGRSLKYAPLGLEATPTLVLSAATIPCQLQVEQPVFYFKIRVVRTPTRSRRCGLQDCSC